MKLKAALLSVSVAIGLHIYLALHYYQLNFGLLTGESLCNVNDLFNCDTVTASSFSAVFGIPIALWGAATNAVLAILIMGWILGWTSDPARQGRYTLWLSGLVAATSVVMGSISTFFIGSFCLFCMGTYLTSFIAFALIYKSQEADSRTSRQYFTEAFSSGKSILYFLIAIPAVTVFFHYSYTSKVGASEMGKAARLSVADWKAAPTVDLSSAQPSFTLGPDNAKMTIAEFADFRCSHCKHASPSIAAFLKSHKDVSLKFYSFPLDGTCNDSMPPGGDGVSCYLAKSVYCAETVAQKGHEIHDSIFEAQEKINQSGLEFSKNHVGTLLEKFKIPADAHIACVESPDTDAAIRAQAKAGQDAGLRGTPFFIINSRRLERGQLLPVLEAAYREL